MEHDNNKALELSYQDRHIASTNFFSKGFQCKDCEVKVYYGVQEEHRLT